MRHIETRILAAAVLFATGCASPFLAGTSSRSTSEGPLSSRSDDRRLADESQPADRAPASRGAAEASSRQRRINDLLAQAARSQRGQDFPGAKTAYEQVLALDPGNLQAHFKLAVVADDEGRFSDAERHYSILLSRHPTNPTLLSNVGWSYFLQGRVADSERTLNEALHYDPNHRTALKNLGWIYGTRGDYDGALALFRRAGSEAEAQRVLAELRQANAAFSKTGSPQLAAAGSRGGPVIPAAAQNATAASPPVQQTGAALATQSGGEPRILSAGPDAGRRSSDSRDDRFAQVDALSAASPSQANRPGVADPGAQNLGLPPLTGTRPLPASTQLATDAAPAGPLITPRTGAAPAPLLGGMQGGRQVAGASPAVDAIAGTRGAAGLPEWPRHTAPVPAQSDVVVAAGTGGTPPLNPADPGAPGGGRSWEEVQRIAAQLAFCTGPCGPLCPIVDDAGPVVSGGATAAPPANPLAPALPDLGGSPTPRARTRDGYVPQSGQPSNWSARGLLPPPIPTDVIPIAEPTPGALPAYGTPRGDGRR